MTCSPCPDRWSVITPYLLMHTDIKCTKGPHERKTFSSGAELAVRENDQNGRK